MVILRNLGCLSSDTVPLKWQLLEGTYNLFEPEKGRYSIFIYRKMLTRSLIIELSLCQIQYANMSFCNKMLNIGRSCKNRSVVWAGNWTFLIYLPELKTT